ncbi:ferrous iron transport protein B [Pirellulaceae bacterium SH501]
MKPSKKSVALIGNPNTGKSSLFNALCGMSARVGNYPGVTVEQKIGSLLDSPEPIDIIDLPGTYSLAARSADEAVTIDVLCGVQPGVSRPDAVVVIVDATNIERNFYLLSQVLDLSLPTLVVLNMWDRVVDEKHRVDVESLSQRLGVTFLCTTASRRDGVIAVRKAIQQLVAPNSDSHVPKHSPREQFPEAFKKESASLRKKLADLNHPMPAVEVDRILIDKDGHFQQKVAKLELPGLLVEIENARERLSTAGCKIPLFETKHRYQWVREQIAGLVDRPPANLSSSSDRIDRWLTHRWVGMAFFIALMFLIFQSITLLAAWPMDQVEAWQGWIQGLVEQVVAPGPFRSLLQDGVIAGIGGVLVFLPQIVILFLFIAILEDCGYMSRAAFVVDKLMSSIGLSGRSFLPLMSSFACAVPGIMATRTIDNVRDRMVTILIAPLMSCSARLPVYVLMVSAFVPDERYAGGWLSLQGIVLFAMHCVGALVAIPVAWFLRKFFFPGQASTFLMELHSYKWPSPYVLFQRVWERASAFVTRAGTLIFCTSVLVWAAGYFPGDTAPLTAAQKKVATLQSELATVPSEGSQAISEQLAQAEEELNQARSALIDASFLGMAGKWIEPVVKPLGWDWKIGVATIASFPAREVIIATLGTIYSLGAEEDEESEGLKAQMKAETWEDGRPVYSLATALSIMVFFALCAQCSATLLVIRRETNSWRWPIFSFVYMTTLAYLGAYLTYTIASAWGLAA